MTVLTNLILALLASGAMAADHQNACMADRAKFCPDVAPGDGRVAECLVKHEKELSADCQAHREKMKTWAKGAKEVCHDDVEKYCAGIKPGKGGIMGCLKSHKKELSEGCKAEFKERRKLRKGKST